MELIQEITPNRFSKQIILTVVLIPKIHRNPMDFKCAHLIHLKIILSYYLNV
jgi:hypothetical protein